MTRDEHIEKHKKLHDALDELIADFIETSPKRAMRLPSKTTVVELMRWSHQQTIEPEVKG